MERRKPSDVEDEDDDLAEQYEPNALLIGIGHRIDGDETPGGRDVAGSNSGIPDPGSGWTTMYSEDRRSLMTALVASHLRDQCPVGRRPWTSRFAPHNLYVRRDWQTRRHRLYR
jgi:hypothetical protein